MVSQCTKFEVSRFTCYEAMNGSAKCRKWGGLRLGGTQGHRQCHHSTSYSTLIENHASILYHFRDIAGYLSKVANFDPPHLYLVPPYGVTPVEFCTDLWRQKTRVPELSCGVVCVILCLAILVELRLVTDRQTDRQTQAHGCIPRMHSIAR